ncbi:hypothetical protein Bca101_072459 [Brassica carinata]
MTDLTEFSPLGDTARENNTVKEGKTSSWNTVPLWDDLIEEKFMGTAPHVAKIHAIVNKIWPLGSQAIRIEVFEVDKTIVKFRIKDANTRARILRHGMWNIANIPMVVLKWSPEEEEEEAWGSSPVQLESLRGYTRTLYLARVLEEAKVFIEANMTKELPKSHHFKSKLGVVADVQFVYPWYHPSAVYEVEGSESSSKQIDQESDASSSAPLAVEPEITHGVEKERMVSDGEERLEDGNIVVDQNQAHEERIVAGAHQQTEEHKETKDDWLNVSPGKQMRSISKINADSNIISSPSRFAILGED